MEDILIPRVSVFLSDMTIWTDITKFSTLTGYVAQATEVTSIDDMELVQPAKASRLARLFGGVQSQAGYESLATNELSDSIFDKKVQTDWRREKGSIMKLISQHQDVMADLKRAQEKCWRSKAKLSKYKLIVATQEAYVALNTEKEQALKGTMKKMKARYDQAVKNHDKEYEIYQKTLLREISCREKLQKLSNTLRYDVADKMTAAISRLMEETNQIISIGEIQRLARHIMKMTSRLYHSELPTSHPCAQDKVTPTQIIGSNLNMLNKIRAGKTQNVKKETTATN